MKLTIKNMSSSARSGKTSVGLLLLVAVVSGAACFGVAALLVNIYERKQEGREPFVRVVEITDDTTDPAEWGKNFPLHYDDYKETVDMEQTMYGGSNAIPRKPTEDDPRNVVSES